MTNGNRFLPAVEKTGLHLWCMRRGTSGALRPMFLSSHYYPVFSMEHSDWEIYLYIHNLLVTKTCHFDRREKSLCKNLWKNAKNGTKRHFFSI